MNKRLILSLISGTTYGVVMFAVSMIGKDVGLSYKVIILSLSAVIGHTLIGFVTGISRLQMRWWLHGMLIGCAVHLARSFTVYLNNINMPHLFFSSLIINGILCGLFVEWVNHMFIWTSE